MKTVFTVLLLVLITRASAQSPPARIGTVKEGVYFLDGMFQTTILELKDGRFRFWFSSDAKTGGEPHYPVSGKYTTNGGTITFVALAASNIWQSVPRVKTNETTGIVETTFRYGNWDGTTNGTLFTNCFWSTNTWTFMNYNGKPTLWRPEALKSWEEKKELDGYGILLPTDKKPEEIWRGN
jgi:hypothetical protein